MPSNPCAIVVFGASGDLAHRKIIPAIYELARDGLLNRHSYIVGFARTSMSDTEFRVACRKSIAQFARTQPIDQAVWADLENRLYYAAADYASADNFARVARQLDQLDQKHQTAGNRLYYLATPPGQFQPIIQNLGDVFRQCRKPANQTEPGQESPWRRVIIEKPFGHDLASARALNQLLHQCFTEEQVFRIDHYLGKETVQNLMVLRFANSIFEPVWNYKYIDHVQITVSETLGVGSRASYYDQSGALRDMVQNHIFQLMALVAMEPPVALDAVAVRDEKVKVYKSIRPMRPSAIAQHVVRGQYQAGSVNGQPVVGYPQEKGVAAASKTETFAAARFFIDNWRWSGTPFYLRTGKYLPQKLSEVMVRFRSPPLTLFQKQCQAPVYPNDLVIRIQPDEGVSLRLNGKVPGGQLFIKPVALDFLYQSAFNKQPPEAYERLIHDAINGEQTLFIRADEAEAAWSVIDPIEQEWARSPQPPDPYAAGAWGPAAAQHLIEQDGRRWLHSGDESEPVIACSL